MCSGGVRLTVGVGLALWCLLATLLHWIICFRLAEEQRFGLYQVFGLSVDGLTSGNLWQIFSYAFFHGNWVHLFSNLVLIYVLGRRVVRIVGGPRTVVALLLGVLLGGAFHVLVNLWSGYSELVLIGASGAAMALLFFLCYLSPDSRMFPLPVSAKNLAKGVMVSSLLLLLMSPRSDVPAFLSMGEWLESMGYSGLFRVSHACHLGGAIAGVWAGRRTMGGRLVSLEQLQKSREQRAVD